MGQAFGGRHSTVIETIETSAKLKICYKISPKFDGVPAIDLLAVLNNSTIIEMYDDKLLIS